MALIIKFQFQNLIMPGYEFVDLRRRGHFCSFWLHIGDPSWLNEGLEGKNLDHVGPLNVTWTQQCGGAANGKSQMHLQQASKSRCFSAKLANAAILVIPASPRMTVSEKVTSFGAMACL